MTDREYGTSGLEEDYDDKELESLGYVPSFKREFSNLATVYFPFTIFVWATLIWCRLALPSASWCVHPCLRRDDSLIDHLIGSLLIRRHYVQYPAALGGPFLRTSTNTHMCFPMIPSKYFL